MSPIPKEADTEGLFHLGSDEANRMFNESQDNPLDNNNLSVENAAHFFARCPRKEFPEGSVRILVPTGIFPEMIDQKTAGGIIVDSGMIDVSSVVPAYEEGMRELSESNYWNLWGLQDVKCDLEREVVTISYPKGDISLFAGRTAYDEGVTKFSRGEFFSSAILKVIGGLMVLPERFWKNVGEGGILIGRGRESFLDLTGIALPASQIGGLSDLGDCLIPISVRDYLAEVTPLDPLAPISKERREKINELLSLVGKNTLPAAVILGKV